MFDVQVKIGLKRGITDPEGENILKSLRLLGFNEVKSVKISKVTNMILDVENEREARDRAKKMCERLLINPVIHDYEIIVNEVTK
jgi:phosphoribosylformylglycinamidine synthase